MSKIFVPTTSPEDWRSLLADPEKHWKRGYSAMAAARSWEAARGLPPEIAAIFEEDTELLIAIPEHKVPLPGGTRESQCDVFAIVRTGAQTCSLAVEAKVNEPFGPTIGEWLIDASTGKRERLDSICSLLGLTDPPPDHIRYQLLHRTAAAIVEAHRFKTDRAAMIVQSFASDHAWYNDFASFCAALNVTDGRNTGLHLELPNNLPLTIGWATGSKMFVE